MGKDAKSTRSTFNQKKIAKSVPKLIDDKEKQAAINSAFDRDDNSPDIDHSSAYRRPGSK